MPARRMWSATSIDHDRAALVADAPDEIAHPQDLELASDQRHDRWKHDHTLHYGS
jgi:hypothetical protein